MITSTRDLTTERVRRRQARLRELEQDREAREAAIFAKIPRLSEIKVIQSEIGLDLARMVLKVPTRHGKPFEELQAWALRLSAERSTLMKERGIDPGELEIKWDCEFCKNTGWLPPEQASSDTVHPAQKCHCLIQEEIDDLYRAAGLAGRLREQTFERFDLSVYPSDDRKFMQGVMEYCGKYALGVAAGTEEESLLLMGDVGLGKTYLSSAIANVVVEERKSVVYFTFSDFLDLIRLHKFGDEEQYKQGVQRLLEADLIILDDLGAEKVTEFVGQELFNLINHRMNRRQPMVVSTNLTPDEVESYYGPRIASRMLYGFEALHLRGTDVREVLVQRKRRRDS